MYKVYKSQKVSIGMPKPLINKVENIKLDIVKNDESIDDKNDSSEYDRIIKEAREMYASILKEANEEANRIIKEKYDEMEELKKKELEEAYKKGFNKGYEEAKAKTKDIIKEAQSIKKSLDDRKESIYREAEEEIVELILNSVKKIIGNEIQQNKDIIISQIKIALEKCTYRDKVAIKVSSEDYPNVLVKKHIIESLVEGISELEIIEDKFLKKGDCIVDTPSGEVNSSIELQLEQLQKAFYFALRNEW
ncbi:FliH/SctL family protein [Lutispora sp.]|uniref:FliH/SctL family protein n=1 Tax=Lutispora sp. TaxID=2828727 RepID=UPI003564477D